MTAVTELTERFEDALAYAAHIHGTQVRKATEIPYVAHLLGVTSIALDYGADEDEAIAALLHDSIEDVGPEVRDEIRDRYGENVLEIVEGCTDTDQKPKPAWRKRKEEYIRHVAGSNPSVLLVSASDKLHNARAILADYRVLGDALWSRFKGGKDGTLWYYRALVDAFRGAGTNPMLVDELDRTVTELEELAADDEG